MASVGERQRRPIWNKLRGGEKVMWNKRHTNRQTDREAKVVENKNIIMAHCIARNANINIITYGRLPLPWAVHCNDGRPNCVYRNVMIEGLIFFVGGRKGLCCLWQCGMPNSVLITMSHSQPANKRKKDENKRALSIRLIRNCPQSSIDLAVIVLWLCTSDSILLLIAIGDRQRRWRRLRMQRPPADQ